MIDSSHDLLVSNLDLLPVVKLPASFDNITAPKVINTKHKIIWSEDGITQYQELLRHTLPNLQSDYSGNLLSVSMIA